jgi:hypothetical protein
MSILNNAIQAMECGIEDYKIGSDARLKSAIRNVHAGVLLLFKEKLAWLSPPGSDEVLLKQQVVPEIAGTTLIWKGQGKKTVDVVNIEKRFDSLGITVDWTAFGDINRIRNEIEHYYTVANANVIREAIAKSFGIASEFLAGQLALDPKQQFSATAWTVFVDVKEVYEQEKARCVRSHADVDCESAYVSKSIDRFSCDECGSDLIFVHANSEAECRSCSRTWDREALIVAIVDAASWGDNFSSVKDGGDPVTGICPECGSDAFIGEEMACAVCAEHQQEECLRCGEGISLGELDGSGFCGYCTHMMSKDD